MSDFLKALEGLSACCGFAMHKHTGTNLKEAREVELILLWHATICLQKRSSRSHELMSLDCPWSQFATNSKACQVRNTVDVAVSSLVACRAVQHALDQSWNVPRAVVAGAQGSDSSEIAHIQLSLDCELLLVSF